MKAEITTERTVRGRAEVNAEAIVNALRKELKIPDGAAVRVYFKVPGGGDWSHQAVDIDDDDPLVVEWQHTAPARVRKAKKDEEGKG